MAVKHGLLWSQCLCGVELYKGMFHKCRKWNMNIDRKSRNSLKISKKSEVGMVPVLESADKFFPIFKSVFSFTFILRNLQFSFSTLPHNFSFTFPQDKFQQISGLFFCKPLTIPQTNFRPNLPHFCASTLILLNSHTFPP